MARKFGVGLAMVVFLALLVWAGVHNYRHRQAVMQKAPQFAVVKEGDQPPGTIGTIGVGTALMGKPAPNFTLTDLQGKKVSLAALKGKPVLVNFWATWCGPCQLEMPWFQQFAEKYKDQGLIVLGVDQDDEDMPKDKIAAAVKRIGVSYPILLPSKNIEKEYALGDYLPETFIVNRQGIVVAHAVGAPSKDEMEAKIQKAL